MKVSSPFLTLVILLAFICLLLSVSPLRGAGAQTKPSAETQERQLQRGEEIKALPGKNKRWALVIGVDDYTESTISKLSGAANDARTLADALSKYAGFPEDQVILLSSDQPPQLQPRRSTILRYLSNLRRTVPKDGLLMVSFAGHGIERSGRAFLLPSDAIGVDDMSLLEDTSISVERLKASIRGVSQVILILDACRSDPEPGRGGVDNLMTEDFRKSFNFDLRNQEIEAFVTLYATNVGERAYEYDVKRQGYFTWVLVEGMRGAAANAQGQVTLQRLVEYLQESVPKLVLRDLGGDKRQRPFAIIEGYRASDLVIAVAATGTGNRADVFASAGISEAAKEQALWDAVKEGNDPRDYQDYLQKYPNGAYADAAKVKLRRLEGIRNTLPSSADKKSSTSKGGDPLKGNKGTSEPGGGRTPAPKVIYVNRPYERTVRVPVLPKTGELLVVAESGASLRLEYLKDDRVVKEYQGDGYTIHSGERAILFKNLPPGQYRVAANLSGYRPATSTPVTVKAGRPEKVELDLEKITYSVSIRLNAASGALKYAKGGEVTRSISFQNGLAVLSGLTGGDYNIEIIPDDGSYRPKKTALRVSGDTQVSFFLDRLESAAFLGASARAWTLPSGWSFASGKMLIHGRGIALPSDDAYRYYKDFQLSTNVRMMNGIAASFAVRLIDPQNYYLIQITGPNADEPYVLRGFVVKNGVAQRFGGTIPTRQFAETLKPGKFFHVVLAMIDAEIRVSVIDSETGDLLRLGLLSDSSRTFQIGAVGIAARDDEQSEVSQFAICVQQCAPSGGPTEVTGALEGRVVDSRTNGPVAGATVQIINVDTQVQTAAKTDADGHFVSGGLQPGRYRLTVTAENFKDYVSDRVQRVGIEITNRVFPLPIALEPR